MELVMNKLPSRTWNHLGMNQAKVLLEGEYKDRIPEAQVPENISWNPDAETVPVGNPGDLEAVTASASKGYALTAAGAAMEKPLVLTYDYEAGEKAMSHLTLCAEKASRMKVVVLLKGKGENVTSLLQTHVFAGDDAVVDLYLVQLLGSSDLSLSHIEGICGDRAKVNLIRLELGGKKACSGVNMDLSGKESDFYTDLGYHGKPGQVLDMNYVALHHGVRTNSLMEISGTLEEGAKKTFRGSIDFQRGCAGAKGTESENVLLMADDVVNQTIPLILCQEEDVEGNHGASIGQLDDKVLFYMGSRGFTQEAAKQIIAQARIEDITGRIPDDSIQELVRNYESLGGNTRGEEL